MTFTHTVWGGFEGKVGNKGFARLLKIQKGSISDASIGHIGATFLALQLEVDPQPRFEEQKMTVSWLDLMRDLTQLQAVRVDRELR